MKIQLFKRLQHGSRTKFNHYFRVRADNGEKIIQSEAYSSVAARNKTVALIRRTNFRALPVQDIGEADL